jgi:hypothetical protein
MKSPEIPGLKRKQAAVVYDRVIEIVEQVKLTVKVKPNFNGTAQIAIERTQQTLGLINFWRKSVRNYMA